MKKLIIETLKTLLKTVETPYTNDEMVNLCNILESYENGIFTSTQDGTGNLPEADDIVPEFIEKKYYPVIEEAIQFFFEEDANCSRQDASNSNFMTSETEEEYEQAQEDRVNACMYQTKRDFAGEAKLAKMEEAGKWF